MFRDAAGNESLMVYDTIILDRVSPVGTITINGGAANTRSGLSATIASWPKRLSGWRI